MNGEDSAEHLITFVKELCKLPRETEWVEFKQNYSRPEDIGEYISALANSATLSGQSFGYIIWGVDDETHAIIGTDFSPHKTKKGNEELENWLHHNIFPSVDFHFYELKIGENPVVLLRVEHAFSHPVKFQSQEYIRIGSYKKKLKDFPEKERLLWRIFDKKPFEEGIAAERVPDDDLLKLLDYPAYFHLMNIPLPENRTGILQALETDELIRNSGAGSWNITNLGAILFAKQLSDFRTLRRKAIRIINYRGNSRVETIKEKIIDKGYAGGFEEMNSYINNLLPSNEIIEKALRKTVPQYPEIAVRELIANALIHQDFFITGAGPMIEIFQNRIEITNPGESLVDTQRFVDSPPKSRNETLASMMRRLRICEERGSGIDKVIAQVEAFQLPAPIFEVPPGFTLAVLFSHLPLAKMDKQDRIRAVYQHACLRYVNRQYLVNSSVRERFGIDETNKATASRLIKDALKAGMIRLVNENVADKMRAYIPYWA